MADVVVYDRLVSPRLLTGCAPTAQLVYAGKEPTRHRVSQRTIHRLLIKAARAGKTVVRLKGGDPFLFGRGGEEAEALAKAKVPYEVVPGVTSAIAVPAYAGIPLTHRAHSSSVAIITGHEDPTKEAGAVRWDRLATSCETLVCLMGAATLPAIVTQLVRHGRDADTPCALIEWGTTPRQRTVTGTLRTIARRARSASVQPPVVFVTGKVVSLRRRLRWFETRPLHGTRILVTRAAEQAVPLAEQLEALGAEVAQLPAIALAPVKRDGLFRDMVRTRPVPDWVFFTSPEGIGWFSKLLKPYHKDVRWLSGCRIGAIGPKTAVAIEARGLHVDFVPKRFSQEGILEGLPRRPLRGKRALILSAEGSRDVLADGLRRRGMQVTKVPLYRTVIPKGLVNGVTELLRQRWNFVTVTSASCVEHLFQALRAAGKGRLFRRLRFASIGPVTSSAVRAHGGRVSIEARTSTIDGLVEAVIKRASRAPVTQHC